MEINENIVHAIKNGEVGVLPTDTIYGVVASVWSPQGVEGIYRAKVRPLSKRPVILVADYDQLSELGVVLTQKQQIALQTIWPGPVSVDVICDESLEHLHRGFKTIAVRMPDLPWLTELLKKTGPIATSSANISDRPYVSDFKHIKSELPGLSYYVEGPSGTTPSRLARVQEDGAIEWLERK